VGARSRTFKNYPTVRGEDPAANSGGSGVGSGNGAAASPASSTASGADDAVAGDVSAVDLPGTSFITLFCDDQKVPLPTTIVDILSKQGEKLVPDSITSLHEVARGVEKERQRLREAGLGADGTPVAPPGDSATGTAAGEDGGVGGSGSGDVAAGREDAVAPTGFARKAPPRGRGPRAGNTTPRRSRTEELIERGVSGSASPPF
jgi:hypothetical protein